MLTTTEQRELDRLKDGLYSPGKWKRYIELHKKAEQDPRDIDND